MDLVFFTAARFAVLRGGAMNMVLFHPLILRDMLRAERMVCAQDNPYAQQYYRPHHKPYYHKYFHARIQFSVQNYYKNLEYTRILR